MSHQALDREFLVRLQNVHDAKIRSDSQLKWYITAIIALAGMNYAELIPDLYTTLLTDDISVADQFAETRKIREALTKCCGIWGAAKVIKPFPRHRWLLTLGTDRYCNEATIQCHTNTATGSHLLQVSLCHCSTPHDSLFTGRTIHRKLR